MLLLLTGAAGGCATVPDLYMPPAAPGMVREAFQERSMRCGRNNCRTRVATGAGELLVESRARTYERDEIPGWSRPRSSRVAAEVVSWMFLGLGGSVTYTEIGLGTHSVVGKGAEDRRLACSTFWMAERQVSNSRRDGPDGMNRSSPLTAGLRCDVTAAPDIGRVLWRFEDGIAPSRDSLAMVFDSLTAAGSPVVGAVPPKWLERIGPDGEVQARFELLEVWPRLAFADENGTRVAVLHRGLRPAFDTAPELTAEERQVLRLVAAAYLISPKRAVGYR
jgi:hypothetical protein